MAGTGSGGGTSFESMSHEQMLAWLDQANSGEVQAAATRLAAAAKEIRKIAEELKVRPQWVEWKGEGADAFRAWANDLANSTHRLGDFSENSAKWLSEASNAIATAQVSIPRDTKSAHANLVAATAAHNDPDAAAIRTKSAAELAALKADQEKVRLEAAAQMRKLGQSYEHSATQMNALPRPKFPPPPAVIAPPPGMHGRDSSGYVSRPTGSGSGTGHLSMSKTGELHANPPGSSPHPGLTAAGTPETSSSNTGFPGHMPSPADLDHHVSTDSVGTVPDSVAHPHIVTTGVPSGVGNPDGLSQTHAPIITPALHGSVRNPTGFERAGRVGPGAVARPNTDRVGPEGRGSGHLGPGRTPIGRTPQVPGKPLPGQPEPATGRTAGGVAGGRPVTPPVSRSSAALPRGTVVGAEQATAKGRNQAATGTTGPLRQNVGGTGQQAGSRRSVFAYGKAVGSESPQPSRGTARRPVSGPAGGATSAGAPVRGGVAGGTPAGRANEGRSGGGSETRRAATPSAAPMNTTGRRSGRKRDREKERSDERRAVPPVAD